jgi:hypothetical protein
VTARRRVLAGLALAAALASCAKPLPDLDAEPAGAVLLPFGERHVDTLRCGDGDCADWYRLEVPAKGALTVEVGPGAAEVPLTGLTARLVDAEGATVASDSLAKGGHLQLRTVVAPGTYLVEVTPADREAAVGYALRGVFKAAPAPPPPPPAPRFETRRAAVLEVEGERTQAPTVLLDAGEAAQLRPGMRGVLVDAGKKLGQVVIVNVYPDGSRARVDGALAGPITPRTVAEIQVPLAPESGAESAPAP